MVYPFNTNMIEKLTVDPVKQVDGCVWFNTSDNVYKAFIDNELHVFLTDKSFVTQVEELVDLASAKNQFVIEFETATSIIVKHNKGTRSFNYQVNDNETNTTLMTSLNIIDENEVRLDFVDPLSGSLFMHFA